jgi:hypothetical protein
MGKKKIAFSAISLLTLFALLWANEELLFGITTSSSSASSLLFSSSAATSQNAVVNLQAPFNVFVCEYCFMAKILFPKAIRFNIALDEKMALTSNDILFNG